MPVEILMPELGESVHEGTVSRWLKKEGEFVKEDEPVVEIMTDKVNTELPAPASGILTKILVPEGENVEVFKAMGLIEAANGAVTAPTAPAAVPAAEASPAPAVSTPEITAPTNGEELKWITPVVKVIAKDHGITAAELSAIQGTGDSGRVTKRDLEAYIATRGAAPAALKTPQPVQASKAEPPKAEPVKAPEPKPVAPTVAGPDQELVTLAGMRKMIAEAMVRSSQVPTVSTVTQCDVSKMVAFREREKEAFLQTYGVKLTYTPFFIKALTETLLEYPLVNSSLQPDGKILLNRAVHIGVAVALGAKGDEGLIVPVIKDAHKKGLIELAKDLEAIAKAARGNTLKPTDVQGGTFTLTNPGTYGALFGTPMINAPQGGILGTYAITKQPVIVEDMIAIRSIMHLVLTYDHRIIDGLLAGKFLAAVRDRLQAFDFFK
jgi:pyruvate/2-oxoglutarate dehydrogenase complex dihydrolipoamide acyltransferase (E2) component